MTDQWDPSGDRSERAPSGGAPSPAPPSAPTPVEPSLTLESEQAVTTGGGMPGGRVVAGIIGVLVLLGGAVFAVTQLGSSGPSSAEDAVRELLDAASDEDVLGLLAALDPGERDALRGPVEDLFGELQRLEVLSDDFELGGVSGLDIEFSDVQLREEPVRDDLVRVYFTGGEVTTGIDGSEVPLGDFVNDTLDRFEVDRSGLDELRESETSDITDDGTFVVARNGSDGWRVSLGYTAAEYARLASGEPLPAEGITPVGADSPEEAVEGMLRAAAEFDLTGAIARLTPGELGALHDYAPLFLDEALGAIEDETSDIDVTIDDLQLRSETDGDRGRVFVDAFALTATVDGETASVAVEDGCFSISGPLVDDELEGSPFESDGPVCPEDLEAASEEIFDQLDDEGIDTDDLRMPTFPTFEAADIGISTARVDGEWYVAPIATFLDSAVTGLRAVEQEHLEGFVDFVESFFDSAFTYEESFEIDEFGDPIDGGFGETPDDFFDEGSGSGSSPTTLGPDGTVDFLVLEEIAIEMAGGDEELGACLLGELWFLDDEVLLELTEAWPFDEAPSPEVQEAMDAARDTCAAV